MKTKKIVIISFTEQGSRWNQALGELLVKRGYICENYSVDRFAGPYGLRPLPSDLKEWLGTQWGGCAFLFIGAAGIAVRLTAPWVKDKFTDSPVVVMDERARYVLPLLSGHVGGASALAGEVAECTGAVPVFTSATDVEGIFAVDVFAAANQLEILDREAAKRISAFLLEGGRAGLFCPYPVRGELPPQVVLCHTWEELFCMDCGIVILEEGGFNPAYTGKEDFCLLRLRPRDLVAGMGCKKGVPCNVLEEGLYSIFEEHGWQMERLSAIVSIDLKRDEKGLSELARRQGVPFVTYPAARLKDIQTVSQSSPFVASVTGVDNVCERAALVHCPQGELLLKKTCLGQMTAAVVRRKVEVWF